MIGPVRWFAGLVLIFVPAYTIGFLLGVFRYGLSVECSLTAGLSGC